MNTKYFIINKPEGSIPLESLELVRRENNIDRSVPMTYAGRLDPMAEGLLLILVGDECKKKDGYLGLDKEYEVEVLLGVGSDTGDVLGIVKSQIMINDSQLIKQETIKEKLELLIGKRMEKYPAFSSKPVNGKPLFMHAKEGNIEDLKLPEKEIEIYSVDYIGEYQFTKDDLMTSVFDRISRVKGDFRQKAVISSWNKFSSSSLKFQIIQIRVRSSSGAYMRTLAQKLGESLGTSALAWKIKRTKIGNFTL